MSAQPITLMSEQERKKRELAQKQGETLAKADESYKGLYDNIVGTFGSGSDIAKVYAESMQAVECQNLETLNDALNEKCQDATTLVSMIQASASNAMKAYMRQKLDIGTIVVLQNQIETINKLYTDVLKVAQSTRNQVFMDKANARMAFLKGLNEVFTQHVPSGALEEARQFDRKQKSESICPRELFIRVTSSAESNGSDPLDSKGSFTSNLLDSRGNLLDSKGSLIRATSNPLFDIISTKLSDLESSEKDAVFKLNDRLTELLFFTEAKFPVLNAIIDDRKTLSELADYLTSKPENVRRALGSSLNELSAEEELNSFLALIQKVDVENRDRFLNNWFSLLKHQRASFFELLNQCSEENQPCLGNAFSSLLENEVKDWLLALNSFASNANNAAKTDNQTGEETTLDNLLTGPINQVVNEFRLLANLRKIIFIKKSYDSYPQNPEGIEFLSIREVKVILETLRTFSGVSENIKGLLNAAQSLGVKEKLKEIVSFLAEKESIKLIPEDSFDFSKESIQKMLATTEADCHQTEQLIMSLVESFKPKQAQAQPQAQAQAQVPVQAQVQAHTRTRIPVLFSKKLGNNKGLSNQEMESKMAHERKQERKEAKEQKKEIARNHHSCIACKSVKKASRKLS